MRIFADYHTHTTFSDGRGKLAENIAAAVNQGLEEIGIADHGPRNIGTGVHGEQTYLQIKADAAQLAKEYPQITVKVGAEANITGVDGSIDISPQILQALDYLIIGLHPYVFPVNFASGVFILENLLAPWSQRMAKKAANDNTKALVETMERHHPQIISHPNLKMQVDVDEVARACAKYGAAYEINVGHNYQTAADIQRVARWGPKFVISSDAHFPATVGRLEDGLRLATAAGLTAEQIINVH